MSLLTLELFQKFATGLAAKIDSLFVRKTDLTTELAKKANSSHKHASADITSLDAAKLTGTISIDRLPQGALDRLVTVADDTARFKLTTANVQLGDTVRVTATGLMYYVVDESKLTTEDGYAVYTAGAATSVPWSGITEKPSTFTPSSHTHNYAGASSAGGAATSANKLNTNAGSATNPVYFANGIPVKTTYTLAKSVPADAKFTDTTYSVMKPATANAAGASGLVPAPASGKQGQYLRGDGTWATPTNTTYSDATASTHGLMSVADKKKLDGFTIATETDIDNIVAGMFAS